MSMTSVSEESFEFDLLVIGLGYVGLPLLVSAAESGLRVVGYDISPTVIERVSDLNSQIHGITTEKLKLINSDGNVLTTDYKFINKSKCVVVCVPTPSTHEHKPNLEFVIQAAITLGNELRPGHVIILESTVAPGTTTGIFRSTIESHSGLTAGEDFNLAFSPERIDPANSVFNLKNTPKIVGGFTKNCSLAAFDFYNRFVESVEIALSPNEAEASKLLENTFRHVNIAFINEFALACRMLGLDVREVIRLASTKPFGFTAFFPSAGAGGHCIPVDPNYFSHALTQTSGKKFEFIELSNKINDAMPSEFAEIAIGALSEMGVALETGRVLVLGLSYKANVADVRETPSLKVVDFLRKHQLDVEIHDPHINPLELTNGYREIFSEDLETSCARADLIILLQNHDAYLKESYLATYSSKMLSPSFNSHFSPRFSF